ncbi:metal-sensitive transcriptional regulator, partial [Agromyces sp. NPDC056379]|uniref:metal-sensitive transcriptional regulator n=1 Tax=Agromyces sp. NPDC056379 TaxID=3345802 RepID=UPI0035E23D3E
GNGVSDGGDHAAGSSCCEPSKPGYENAGSKDALSKRLKRIEGQVRGVEKMVADDRYCIDVLTQIAAIQSGLKAVALGLLDDHMAHCVVEAARAGGDEQATKLAEVSDALRIRALTLARLAQPGQLMLAELRRTDSAGTN